MLAKELALASSAYRVVTKLSKMSLMSPAADGLTRLRTAGEVQIDLSLLLHLAELDGLLGRLAPGR